MQESMQAPTPMPEQPDIPVLDVAAFLAGEPGAAPRLATEIKRSCENTGFLVISNHGIAPNLIERAFASAAQFFELDLDKKLALKIGAKNIGYLPYGGQTMKTSTIEVAAKPNFSESFYITTPDPDPRVQDVSEDLNKWPPDMAEFKTIQIEYFQTMRAFAAKFLALFALALELDENYFEDDFEGPNCTVRLIRYHPQPPEEANLYGFAAHTDGSFITFLPRSQYPGLEVQTKSGAWIRPPDISNTFVVNTGEMLARYSNDRFVPTPHRVINRSGRIRHAMPFFFGPNRQRIIHCAANCVDDAHPAKYEPMSSAQLNAIKDKTNFPHRQATS